MSDLSNDTQECPTPPRRLVTDHVFLKKSEEHPAWEARRANKMRIRFPVTTNPPPVPNLDLIAPVQPDITLPPFTEKSP